MQGELPITPMKRSSQRHQEVQSCKSNTSLKSTKCSSKELKNTKRLQLVDIKNIYLNKDLKKFISTNLETIYEEPIKELGNLNEIQIRFMGKRKIKRSVHFHKGLYTSKTLTKRRRCKIQKKFGRKTIKKISMKKFLEKLKSKDAGDAIDSS